MYAFAYLFHVNTGKTVTKYKSWFCNGCAIVTVIGWCWTTGVPVAGIGFTGALASVPPKRGDHRYGPLSCSLFSVKNSGPLHTHFKVKRGKWWLWCCHRHEFWWLLWLWVGLTIYVIPKRASWDFKDPRRILPPVKGEHLERAWTSQPAPVTFKGKPLDSHWLVENIQFTQLPRLWLGGP